MANKFALFLITALIVLSSSSAKHSSDRVTPESFADEHLTAMAEGPIGWEREHHNIPSKNTVLKLTFALKQRNLDRLENLFHKVSNPKTSSYKNYLSQEELGDIISPHPKTVAAVRSWLETAVSKDSIAVTENKEFIRASMSVATAEALLQTEFAHFVHRQSGTRIIRAVRPYTVPVEVASHLDFIGGLHRFPTISKTRNGHAMLPSDIFSDSTSNAPVVVSNHQAEGQLQMFFALKCYSGQFATSQTCSDGNAISGVSVTGKVSSPQFSPAVSDFSDSTALSTCQPCSKWQEPFLDTCNGTGVGLDVLFCLYLNSALENYVPYSVGVSVSYSSGQLSSAVTTVPITTFPWTTTSFLRKSYNIPMGARGVSSQNTMAVIEFLGQFYSQPDLDKFLYAMGDKPQVGDVDVVGPNDQTNPGGEASLDIQFLVGLAPNISTMFYINTDLYNGQEPFLEWAVYMANSSAPPLVQSVSYDDQEYSLTAEYVSRLNTEFAKLGVRGVSLLFAAGDDGAAGYDARSNSSYCAQFNPTFPGSSPYATSIGGTQMSQYRSPICQMSQGFSNGLNFNCDRDSGVGEVVCSVATGARITTGGGFSNFNSRPAYQESAVAEYLLDPSVPSSNLFNSSSRGYPDISSQAHNYPVYINGTLFSVDGTSASTPVIAAMIALINDKLLQNGQKPMGFLNYFLYQVAFEDPETFTDVVNGNNACTANVNICCPQGYSATRGWDPTTGLGIPNFMALRSAALASGI